MSPSRRVLLLEPDASLRDLLRSLLSEEGFAVSACSSLLDVLARAEGVRGEVAIVDIWGRTPEIERCTLECLRRLGGLLPLVVITDEPWRCAPSAEELRAVAVLPKPFSIEAVIAAAHRAASSDPARQSVRLSQEVSARAC